MPLNIAVDMTIAGDRMVLDFSRSSEACTGPRNSARATAIACCYVGLKHMFPDVPANAGCLAPIEFVIPPGSILAVEAPKPVGGYTETILRVIGVLFGAMAKAAPERATAAPFGTINALSLAGKRANGQNWVMFSFFGGGLGGNPVSDGLHHGNNPISMATMPPVEIFESAYPIMFTQWALRDDSGGPGEHRGGVGAIYEIEALEEGGMDAFLLGERGRFAPFGVEGGGAGALNTFGWREEHGSVEHPPMASKTARAHVGKNGRVRLDSPGGGGHGDPLARDPARVARDVRLG